MLVAMFISSAYMSTKAVDAGVSISKGFYADYAYGTRYSNSLALWEFVIIGLWLIWAGVLPIVGIFMAMDAWNALTERIAEAEDFSVGLEEALTG
jgi:hypothetical protein